LRELRFIVTNTCNYNCFFCHGEGIKGDEKNQKLNSKDYSYIFKVCKKKYGWSTVTITGGEPLIRNDIKEICSSIFIEDGKTTLVTNGSLIYKYMDISKYLDKINISLHCTEPNIYNLITGKSKLEEVINNIKTLRNKQKKLNIRLNTTIISGVNDSTKNITDLIKFAEEINASIKFMELYSDNMGDTSILDKLESILRKSKYELIHKDHRKANFSNNDIDITLSKLTCTKAKETSNPKEYGNKFNDIFVAPDGTISLCMNSKVEISILDEVKSRDDIKLIKRIDEALYRLGENCIYACNAIETEDVVA